MFNKQNLDDLSVEELEKALRVKRRQARLKRFDRLSSEGRSRNEALTGRTISAPLPTLPNEPLSSTAPQITEDPPAEASPQKKRRDMILLGLEATAVAGLVVILVASYFNLRELNDEVAVAQQNALQQSAQQQLPVSTDPISTAPPAIARLPGGHSPPTDPGGAVPDVPLHLQRWVQPTASLGSAAIQVEAPTAPPPTRIVIPKINVDAPIINGVGWEDLKKGVGHLPGSANPGQRGNLYLAAHNDIYGEIFRHLGDLEVGDAYIIYSGQQKYRYIVKEKSIIEPTEVDVMLPTTEPVATLQTCYPYLIDTHRLIVVGELAE